MRSNEQMNQLTELKPSKTFVENFSLEPHRVIFKDAHTGSIRPKNPSMKSIPGGPPIKSSNLMRHNPSWRVQSLFDEESIENISRILADELKTRPRHGSHEIPPFGSRSLTSKSPTGICADLGEDEILANFGVRSSEASAKKIMEHIKKRNIAVIQGKTSSVRAAGTIGASLPLPEGVLSSMFSESLDFDDKPQIIGFGTPAFVLPERGLCVPPAKKSRSFSASP
jgi:hypothetical protein